jgi:hypothetical protein
MIAFVHEMSPSNTPAKGIFAEAVEAINSLKGVEVKDEAQTVEIKSTSRARNEAILAIIQWAYTRAIGDRDDPNKEMSFTYDEAQNISRFTFPVPEGMDRLPVTDMERKARDIQKEIIEELDKAKPYVMYPDPGNVYKVHYDHVEGSPDDKFEHALFKNHMISMIAKAHGCTELSIDHMLTPTYLKKYTCIINEGERDAVLQHERPASPGLPGKSTG